MGDMLLTFKVTARRCVKIKRNSNVSYMPNFNEENIEQLTSLIRVGLPGAFHGGLPVRALIATANVPLMRVWFLSVIPAPVTDYALVNLQCVRKKLSQTMMSVLCDKGVFHTFRGKSQTHLRPSVTCLEDFTARRFYYIAEVFG